MKRCGRCGEDKPLTAFQTDRSKRCGKRSVCRSCGNAQSVAWKRRVGYVDVGRERTESGRAVRLARQAQYRMEQRDKVYLHNDLRRARERAAYVEPVLRLVVFDRDGWECHECGGICDPHGPRAERPSLDHLVPLSEGGAHSYDNVATAHVGCNSRRYHLGRKRPDSPIPEVVG